MAAIDARRGPVRRGTPHPPPAPRSRPAGASRLCVDLYGEPVVFSPPHHADVSWAMVRADAAWAAATAHALNPVSMALNMDEAAPLAVVALPLLVAPAYEARTWLARHGVDVVELPFVDRIGPQARHRTKLTDGARGGPAQMGQTLIDLAAGRPRRQVWDAQRSTARLAVRRWRAMGSAGRASNPRFCCDPPAQR